MQKTKNRFLSCIMIFLITFSFLIIGCNSNSVYAKNVSNTTEPLNNINYRIDAKLDHSRHEISGIEHLKFTNIYDVELNELVFNIFADSYNSEDSKSYGFKKLNEMFPEDLSSDERLGYLNINSIKNVENKDVKFTKNNQILRVSLNKPLKKGESVNLKIDFKTKFPMELQRTCCYKQVYSGLFWYPMLAVYEPKEKKWNEVQYSKCGETDYYEVSNYEVNLEVPKDFTVEFAGITTEKINGDKKLVSSIAKNTREMALFASPKFKRISKTKKDLTITMLYLSNGNLNEESAYRYVDTAFETINFFNEKYGKYPYKDFDIVETFVPGFNMEYTRAVQMMPLSPVSYDAIDPILVHEIAHQWFHSVIGNNSEKESCLDESLTEFASSYFLENNYPKNGGFKDIINKSEPINLPINSPNSKMTLETSKLYYEKGGTAFYELYRIIGEDKFNQLIKEYFNKYKFKNATLNDFLAIVENNCGKEVKNHMYKCFNEPNYKLDEKYIK
ncbi:M1 family metallopeptidase [Clostridium sporogenes]|uniref:M1 family metallopeptidase n=1 Tax=Clostridium sporogenes TaxID=1509 RepID=UPI00313B195A